MAKVKKAYPKDAIFLALRRQHRAVVYQEIRLRTRFSDIIPAETDVQSRFSRNVPIHIPIASAAMDTITESKLAIALAMEGGIGVIHRKLTAEAQAAEVERTKRSLNEIVRDPACASTTETVREVLNRRELNRYSFHSFPVLDEFGKVAGVITHHDFSVCLDKDMKVADAMTPLDALKTSRTGTTTAEAFTILRQIRKNVLLVINERNELDGMYVLSDLMRLQQSQPSMYNVDAEGHLRVGAAVGTGDAEIERAIFLDQAGCDAIVIDTAHAHSSRVLQTLRALKKKGIRADVVVGNTSEPDAAKALVSAGADGVKVGVGPGSICSTRIVAGVGCPQATAIFECCYAIRGSNVPVCADGGITESGDIPIALSLGAESVMIGNLLAGTEETPGEIHKTDQGEKKLYRGMGSESAMSESSASLDRYNQPKKFAPEGVETLVSTKGKVAGVVQRLVGGLRSGLGYVGARTIQELQEVATYYIISSAGYNESAPHHVNIIPSKDVDRWR